MIAAQGGFIFAW